MPLIDGLKRRYEKKGEEDEPVFSELFTSPELEERVKSGVNRFSQKANSYLEQSGKRISDISQNIKFDKILKKRAIKKQAIFKGVAVFMVLFILSSVTFVKAQSVKDKMDALAEQASTHLEEAFGHMEEGDMEASLNEADEAKKTLSEAKLLVQAYGQDINYLKLLPNYSSKLVAEERLLDASYLVLNTISSVSDQFKSLGLVKDSQSPSSKFSLNISDNVKALSVFLDQSTDNLSKSKAELTKARQSLDSGLKGKVDQGIAMIDGTLTKLDFYHRLLNEDLPWLAGEDGQGKHIMIIFQNNAELRGGSGGSLGSFGIAHFYHGDLVNIDFGQNIFTLDQVYEVKNYVEPPEIIKLLRGEKSWTMKDAGWPVDGPSALKNISNFYNKETGQKVDGVITIDVSSVTSLLKVIGPIEVRSLGKTITSDNFRSEIEYEVHKGYFTTTAGKVENEPKSVINEMMPLFIDKVLKGLSNRNQAAGIIGTLSKSLKSKDMLFFFENKGFEERIESLNLTGKVYPAIGDYFYINNSNIDGGKSSLSVEEKVNLSISINDDGSVKNQLDLIRNHQGKDVWPDGLNKNFVRILLPGNAKIEKFQAKAGNFEQMSNQGLKGGSPYWTEKEGDKSLLNFWISTKPGEESEAIVRYDTGINLNLSGDFTYNLALQKQPGANPDDVTIKLTYPEGFSPANVKNFDSQNRTITLTYTLAQDKTFKIKFKKS